LCLLLPRKTFNKDNFASSALNSLLQFFKNFSTIFYECFIIFLTIFYTWFIKIETFCTNATETSKTIEDTKPVRQKSAQLKITSSRCCSSQPLTYLTDVDFNELELRSSIENSLKDDLLCDISFVPGTAKAHKKLLKYNPLNATPTERYFSFISL
jgi:hypothetical protein